MNVYYLSVSIVQLTRLSDPDDVEHASDRDPLRGNKTNGSSSNSSSNNNSSNGSHSGLGIAHSTTNAVRGFLQRIEEDYMQPLFGGPQVICVELFALCVVFIIITD